MPLFLNPFTGNIEFKPTGGGGGGGITGSGALGQVAIWNSATSLTGTFSFFYDSANIRVGIGSSAPEAKLHILENTTNLTRGILIDQYSMDINSPRLFLRKSRGAIGLPSVINSGDNLGEVLFSGYDSTNFLTSAIIRSKATGTVLGTRVPSILEFQTSTNATPSVLTTALTLNETQKATFANNIELTSLSVFDTVSGTYKIVLDSSAGSTIRFAQQYQTVIFSPTTTTFTFSNAFLSWNFPGGVAGAGVGLRIGRTTVMSHTTGSAVQLNTTGSFVVASGNGGVTLYNVDLVVNQTATANGVITGVDIFSVPFVSITGSVFGLRSRINSGTPGGSANLWNLFIDGTEKNSIVGFIKFGAITAPQARVDIAPGSTGSAPLKLSTGVLTTGPAILPGNIEYNTDNYYLTGDTGLTRKVARDLSYSAITIGTAIDGRHEFVDCTTGTFTVTLPTAIGFLKQYTIFNSGTGVITINTILGQTINGETGDLFTLVQNDCIILRSNGANWYKLN